ncbi:SDR family oxidoreductase [Luteipulveratus halotolerans]|uniref:Ketoreductase domain-containing protein n=1 Tax=Luteipulveratus halotolerans TaxID=1631356 RepID=A0A0L6CM28_9MICO|nr:SDR family oxidoreductase [Luteipulveratus halotolerans]KNX38690.1 hypothetical protein VV01_18575 [Luteipulveratus halotolerans]
MEVAVKDTVVITGGTSGVGRACARAFARDGHPVAVLARGQDALDATLHELRAAGVPALALRVDVTDQHAVDEAADRVERELGAIGVWVNDAMVTVLGTFADVPADDFDRVVDVVLGGTAHGTRAALRHMRPRDRGRIIQVGSALAYRGIPLQSAYCSGKHAVQGLCDSLRADLLHEHSAVTVSEVNLPAMNTPQFDMCANLLDQAPMPVPPIYQPEVAARAVQYAARTGERAVEVSFTTTRTLVADRFLPGSMDLLLGSTGVDSQQTDRERPPGGNLWDPAPGDHGCHGSFDRSALDRSRQEDLRRTPVGTAWRVGNRLGRRVGARVLRRLM